MGRSTENQLRRVIAEVSPEHWDEFERRVAVLLAEAQADEEVGAEIARDWLAGRAAERKGRAPWCVLDTDGFSIRRASGDCLLTWVPGPRRLYDPDVALLSCEQLRAGSFAIRAWWGVRRVLETSTVPFVEVRPPYPMGRHRTDPEDLERGWRHSQAVVHMLLTGEHLHAAKELVWAWRYGDPDDEGAQFIRPWCRAIIHEFHAPTIALNEACVLTWSLDRRVALLSARRYERDSFRRIMRDAIRIALEHHDVEVQEVAPRCQNACVPVEALLAAWEEQRPRVMTG